MYWKGEGVWLLIDGWEWGWLELVWLDGCMEVDGCMGGGHSWLMLDWTPEGWLEEDCWGEDDDGCGGCTCTDVAGCGCNGGGWGVCGCKGVGCEVRGWGCGGEWFLVWVLIVVILS